MKELKQEELRSIDGGFALFFRDLILRSLRCCIIKGGWK